jgi:hypothetical protein
MLLLLIFVSAVATAKPELKGDGKLRMREGWLDKSDGVTVLRAQRPGVIAPSWLVEWDKSGAPAKLCLGAAAACPRVTLYYRAEVKRGPATVLTGAFVGPSFEQNVQYQKAYQKSRPAKAK